MLINGNPPKDVLLYDLAVMPTTFDFAVYAVVAKTIGYKEIRFVIDGHLTTKKYGEYVGWRRFGSIVIPLCYIAGIPYSVGSRVDGDEFRMGYYSGFIETLYKQLGRIEKLKPTQKALKEGYITITMRSSFRNKWRDSNRPEWIKIQKWLQDRGEEVVVVEECEHQPLDLEYRMALYCGAKMNLAVGNGPMVLCWLSEAPYLTFQLPKRDGREKKYDDLVAQWDRIGFPVGSQLSFRNDKQLIVWGPDDFDLVTSEYEKMFKFDKAIA